MLSAIQTSRMIAVRERSRGATSSTIDELGSGSETKACASTGVPVICSRTAPASAPRPFRARKYGLSGSETRATNARKAGNEAARKSQRHAQSPPTCSRKNQESPVASRSPTGQKRSSTTRKRPRFCGGRYSASMAGSTTSIAPRPMPARKRKADSDPGPHANAVSAVKTAYQRIAVWKMRRRPTRSAVGPRTRLPSSDPPSAEAAIQPA